MMNDVVVKYLYLYSIEEGFSPPYTCNSIYRALAKT